MLDTMAVGEPTPSPQLRPSDAVPAGITLRIGRVSFWATRRGAVAVGAVTGILAGIALRWMF
jgi:hypothetical protein